MRMERSPLHPNQHAYRAGRSADTALYSLVTDVENAFVNGEAVLLSRQGKPEHCKGDK